MTTQATRTIPAIAFPFIVDAFLRWRARRPFLCPICERPVKLDCSSLRTCLLYPAGYSTTATTRAAWKRPERTTTPVRVTSDTST
jgi:hypothetical protein